GRLIAKDGRPPETSTDCSCSSGTAHGVQYNVASFCCHENQWCKHGFGLLRRMARLLRATDKTDIERGLQNAGRTRHIAQLPYPLLFQLRAVEKVLWVEACGRGCEVEARHLCRTPPPDNGWAVLKVPGQPGDKGNPTGKAR